MVHTSGVQAVASAVRPSSLGGMLSKNATPAAVLPLPCAAGNLKPVFEACITVYSHDSQTALFLLPHLVQNALSCGSEAAQSECWSPASCIKALNVELWLCSSTAQSRWALHLMQASRLSWKRCCSMAMQPKMEHCLSRQYLPSLMY